ncbi:hypothetical protein BGX31_010348 [Mortierella sp. GBA43]|nr:hypothetical protein BGX31_010348 [Mortierella sp. GBA43]
MTPTQEFYTFCGNLLRKYKATIQHLRILQPIAASTVPHFPIDTLINAGTSSKLSHLEMEGLTMSRDGFSSFLQACPSLHSLGLRRMTLLSGPIYYPSGDNYYPKHHTLQTLSASIKQVFMPDVSNKSRIPPLLVHFPGLKSWRILNEGTTSSHEIPIIEIRDQVIEFCPSITSLELYIPPPVTVDILAHVIRKVAKVYVLNKHLSTEVVMAILHHQETLTNVGTFPSTADMYNSDSVPNVERNQLEGAGWIIQSIPRRCTSLTILCLPLFEMSMDDIEKAEWACQKLKILYFRVQGLNTKEKIDRAIQLWMEARIPRRKKRASKNRHKTIPNSDNSIEARVARHLLKFKKLREVWLGYKIRKVA